MGCRNQTPLSVGIGDTLVLGREGEGLEFRMPTPRSGAGTQRRLLSSSINAFARFAQYGVDHRYGCCAGSKVIAPMPAAILRPVAPSMLSGSSISECVDPPMRTLAEPPTPTETP